MLSIPEYILYVWIIFYGIYCILIVPYFGSKILLKTGESERFWFFILVLLNFWALLFILLRPSFRKGIDKSDIKYLSLFAIGYLVIFLPIVFILSNE